MCIVFVGTDLREVKRMKQSSLNDYDSREDARFYIEKSKIKRTRAESVLWAFETSTTGCTDQEVADILEIQRSSVIARRHDLMRKFPDKFYSEEKRLSKYGIGCDVWKCQ